MEIDNTKSAKAEPGAKLEPEAEALEIILVDADIIGAQSRLVQVQAASELHAALTDVTGQLSPRSRRVYNHDAGHFARWLQEQNLTLQTLTKSNLVEYRRHLGDSYAKATAARMLIVARRLLDEAVEQGLIAANPAKRVKGFKLAGSRTETTHTALTRPQARELLAVIDRETLIGQRDYALIMLLLRTGMRRSEAAALELGDLTEEAGHPIALLRHAKGDFLHTVKLSVDTLRAINEYLEATGRLERKKEQPNAPLFIQFRKSKDGKGKPTEAALSDRSIAVIVGTYAARLGLKLSPHGLRASFVTLALEGGAKLQQVQYAVGHADPRTTERYQKRRLNLDDNATDYLRM